MKLDSDRLKHKTYMLQDIIIINNYQSNRIPNQPHRPGLNNFISFNISAFIARRIKRYFE